MSFWDKILGFFGIRRIQLDKPLTLLGHYYYKVLDKIANGYYSEVEDVDWGVNYIRNDEEDRNVTVCQWETIKIMHTIRHDETDSVVAAGRIYIDKDESFLDDIIRKVTLGKKRVHGKIDYRHHGCMTSMMSSIIIMTMMCTFLYIRRQMLMTMVIA